MPPSAVTCSARASSASTSQLHATSGQQWVDGLAGVEVGLDVGDQPHRAVPRLGALGVVQQDQSTERVALRPLGDDVGVGMPDLGAQRVAERRQPLRRADRAELDFRSHGGGIHRLHRFAELSRFGGGHAV